MVQIPVFLVVVLMLIYLFIYLFIYSLHMGRNFHASPNG
jgi:hypothetical protein